MTFKEFIPLALKTFPNLEVTYPLPNGEIFKSGDRPIITARPGSINISHLTQGIMTEYDELEDALEPEGDKIDMVNVAEELADSLWYLGCYIWVRSIDQTPFVFRKKGYMSGKTDGLKAFRKAGLGLLDMSKKYLAYGKIIDEDKEARLCYSLFSAINDIAYIAGIDIYKAMDNVIDKLHKKRYSNAKFNENDAINRDLKGERNELEK